MAYTFKDDGAMLTYYREYNKEVNAKDNTLVGNWVEERALKEEIGTGRYALWVNKGDEKSAATEKQRTFTKFVTRPDALDTFSRTLAHSEVRPSPAQPPPRHMHRPTGAPRGCRCSTRHRPST